ncbi:MAG: hypothetical protein KDA87_08800 [Planctomycetales bacterium]|nr:hypothetical protein [Planctomycetales bacterium]
MQLDRTRIYIRERSLPEQLDLAFRVSLEYLPNLLFFSAVVIAPLMVLNAVLLNWCLVDEFAAATISQYLALLITLMVLELPFATIPITVFLGRIMFRQPTDWKTVFGESAKYLLRFAWSQLLVRGIGLGIFLLLAIRPDAANSETITFLVFTMLYVLFARMLRPFVNEIIFLERNPIRSGKAPVITVRRRSISLHRPSTPDMIARFIMVSAACVILSLALILTCWFMQAMTTNNWRVDRSLVMFFVPLSVWIVAVQATVIRFVGYLDLRIRREGWEVELKVRAAAAELKGQLA